MNNTPNSNRKHITIYGKRNAGKSSLINAIIGQEIALVSDVKGTTTDPVKKAMELIPFGPVVFTDTAGLDDIGELGSMRVERTMKMLDSTDLAIYVLDGLDIDIDTYKTIKREFKRRNIPYMTVINKADVITKERREHFKKEFSDAIIISTQNLDDILNLKDKIIENLKDTEQDKPIIGDLLPYGSKVVLVVPVDSEAPKGRLILPQVQLIRDCLDHGIKSYVVRDTELEEALEELDNIDMVITDSQAFKAVSRIVPNDIRLTSFSILLARQKGDLRLLVDGLSIVDLLDEDSKILIAESCTHNYSHEDIGRVKIPNLLRKHTNKNLEFDFKTGADFPKNLEDYDLVIHCASCMQNRKAMLTRINDCVESNTKITNYGVLLAYLNGILDRSIQGII